MLNTIEPDAVYTEHQAWAWFNIGHATQKAERDAGRLQYAMVDGKPTYRGAWLLAWFESSKTTGPASAAQAAKRIAVPGVPAHAASAGAEGTRPDPAVEARARQLYDANGYDWQAAFDQAWREKEGLSTHIPPTPSGAPTVPQTQRDRDLARAQAQVDVDRWDARVETLMSQGLTKANAIRQLCAAEPDMHAAYLAGYNLLHNNGDPRRR